MKHNPMAMANQEVKLLGCWVSPFVYRVRWALKLKGVDFEYVEEEDLFDNKSDLLLKSNPVHKKVPVLLHNGKPIAESLLILEYIDEIWKQNPILPQDPYERAMARFLAKSSETQFLEAAWVALCTEGEKQEKSRKTVAEFLEILDEQVKGKKFFGGETIGYVDIALGWVPHWLEVWEEVGGMKIMDPNKFPSFNAWMKNFLEFPIIKEKLPPRDRMVLYFRDCHQVYTNLFK